MPIAQPAAGVADPVGPDQWFKSLPIITQYWFGATLIVTLSANFQIVNPMQVIYIWESMKQNFELWRIITCFCYAGPFDFSTLISCYMLVQFSKQYEVGGPFNTGAGGGTADYAFMMLFGMISILITYTLLPLPIAPVFCRNLIYYVLYVWSKRHPTQQANLWGFPMAAIYLPFAYLMLTVFMGADYMGMLHGMAIGHIYYFLVDVVPVVHGKDIISTPTFLIDYFGVGLYEPQQQNQGGGGGGMGGFGNNVQQRQAPQQPPARGRGGGYNWGGGGRALGAE